MSNSLSSDALSSDFISTYELPIAQLRNYELLRVIGEAPTSAVCLASGSTPDRLAAIKVLKPDLASSSNCVWRFISHASTAANLVHPSILPVLFVGQEQGFCFSIREFINGESLKTKLNRGDVFSPGEALNICGQILDGLVAAHESGIAHGNLKASNVLLDLDQQRVVISDFHGASISNGSPDTNNVAIGLDPDDVAKDLRLVGKLLRHMLRAVVVSEISSEGAQSRQVESASRCPSIKSAGRIMDRLLGQEGAKPFDTTKDALKAVNDLTDKSRHPYSMWGANGVVRNQHTLLSGKRYSVVDVPSLWAIQALPEGIQLPDDSSVEMGWGRWVNDRLTRWSPWTTRFRQKSLAVFDEVLEEMSRRHHWLNGLVNEGEQVRTELHAAAESNHDHDRDASTSAGTVSCSIQDPNQRLEELHRQLRQLDATIGRLERQCQGVCHC